MFGDAADDLLVGGYGLVTIGAIIAACLSAPSDRRDAFLCAVGLHASWVIYVLAWTPWSPAIMLTRYAFDTDSVTIWSLCNCANAILALYLWVMSGRGKDWLICLYVLLLSACYFDVLWWADVVSWDTFRRVIDTIFVGEMALLYMLGAGNAADVVGRCYVRWHLRFSVRPTRAQKTLNRHG